MIVLICCCYFSCFSIRFTWRPKITDILSRQPPCVCLGTYSEKINFRLYSVKIRYIVFTTYFSWFISLEIFFFYFSLLDYHYWHNCIQCIENEWLSLYEIKELLYKPFVDDFALGAKQFMVVYMLKRFDFP